MPKVLFLSSDFYEYTRLIVENVRKSGLEIDWFDVRPKMSDFEKWRASTSEKRRDFLIKKYLCSILEKINPKNYSLVLVNSPLLISGENISFFLSHFPGIPHILNLWDSIKNYPILGTLIPHFDRCYSSELPDCEKYGLIFQPDFYDPKCLNFVGKTTPAYDVSFVGAAYGDRYQFFDLFTKEMRQKNISCHFYLFIPSKKRYLFYKMTNKSFRKSKINDFQFSPLDSEGKNRFLADSKAIIDVHLGAQEGTSNRMVEAMVMHKKLITTSKGVRKFSFYREENVAIIEGTDFHEITSDFLNSPFFSVDDIMEEGYSVESFVHQLIVSNIRR